MKRLLEYEWFIDNDTLTTDELESRLDENANDRIYNMINDGYTSGELCYDDDDFQISGWWNLKKLYED